MKTKTSEKTESSKTDHTITDAKPCIFTSSDRNRLKKLLSKDSFDELMTLTDGDAMPKRLFDAKGETIEWWEISPISLEHWHDSGYLYIYRIGKKVYVLRDDDEFTVHKQEDVRDMIYYIISKNDGYYEDRCGYNEERRGYYEERCVSFDVKPDLTFAKRSHVGICRVWINTFYRDEHLRTSDLSSWVRGDDGEIIRFDSYSEARKWINQDKKNYYTDGMYHFKYNEYAYRQYKICE